MRYWRFEDIFEIVCPRCGASNEFFKDEPRLNCRSCRAEIRNPRHDPACAEWCRHAPECLNDTPPDNPR